MFSIFRTTLHSIPTIVPKIFRSNFHMMLKPTLNILPVASKIGFLVAETPSITQICGFKVKGKLRRRCKDCFFVRRQERLYVICKTHPRHKQMSMVPDPKTTWIITHATQGKFRQW